jgi:hypothetical protein
MKKPIGLLIHALREELKEYGELLALLDQQQQQTEVRAADDLLQTVAAIHSQGATIQTARRNREKLQRAVALQFGLAPDAPLSALLPLLPKNCAPLVRALIEENHALLERVRRRANQNQQSLRRSLEMMQRFLGTLLPSDQTVAVDDRVQTSR